MFGWLDKCDYSLKEINVSHLPAHELDYFVDTGFLKKERDNINHHHPSVLDIDERDMKVIQVFICHVSFVPAKFVFACLTQFDGCEQCGSESEDFFFSHKHVIPDFFCHVTKSYTKGPWKKKMSNFDAQFFFKHQFEGGGDLKKGCMHVDVGLIFV